MDRGEENFNKENKERELELAFFDNNDPLSFIHKKCQKISCAVYLVTNHLSDREPLKNEIRAESLFLVKDTVLLLDGMSSSFTTLDKFKKRVTTITSFLNLLLEAGFISKMNHDILASEVLNTGLFLKDGPKSLNYLGPSIDKNFFDIPKPETETSGSEYDERFSSEGHFLLKQEDNFLKDISKGHINKRQLSFKNNKDTKGFKQSSGISSERKKKIVNYIKSKKKEVGVKDISEVVRGFSEKTIQRDLVALVKDGVLKKKGERRWSTYSIA